MAEKKTNKKNKKNGFTAAFIILCFLVIFILFLVKKDTIITNLKETRFFDRVFGTTPAFVEKHQPSEKNKKDSDEDGTVTLKIQTDSKNKQSEKQENKSTSEKENTAASPAKTEPVVIQKEEKSQEISEQTEKKEQAVSKEPEKTATNNSNTTNKIKSEISYTELQLCFVEIDSDGSVVRKMIKRTIPKNDSPLTTSLKLLLQGPESSNSSEKTCITLIPEGTKLLSAKIQNGVAYLDFSENFEFNEYGVEGYNGQLMQIVYTATAFSTVKSVQFLIEGQKKEYLGSEGQWIGSPISRSAFK